MLMYLASGTPLPTGRLTRSINNETYAIHIFEYAIENPPTRILPDVGELEVSQEVQDECMLNQDVTGHFTLPYIYYLGMGCCEVVLRDFLCEYLKPGENAEVYYCWAAEEREERDRKWDQVVDLQDFIDCGSIEVPMTDYNKEVQKHFITYRAPLKI